MATGPPTSGPEATLNTTLSQSTTSPVDLRHSTGATINYQVTQNYYNQVTITVDQVIQSLIHHVDTTMPPSPEKQTMLDHLRTAGAAAANITTVAAKIPDLMKLVNLFTGSPTGGV